MTAVNARRWPVKIAAFILLALAIGCRTKPDMVPVAHVWYDGYTDGAEIIATLQTHHINAVWQREATVVFPILVPVDRFDSALAILQTNSLVAQGKVRLYPRTKDVK